MTKKRFLSFNDHQNQLAKIHRQMANDEYKPDVIVGIVRGGLIPAVGISHYYDVPLYTINVSFRDTKIQGGLEQLFGLLDEGKKVLLVDDICDSGETLHHIYESVKTVFNSTVPENLKTAVLVHNEGCNRVNTPDYYGLEINKNENDEWIVFFWEQD